MLDGDSFFGLPWLQVRGFAPLAVQAPGVEQPCSTAGTAIALAVCLLLTTGLRRSRHPAPIGAGLLLIMMCRCA